MFNRAGFLLLLFQLLKPLRKATQHLCSVSSNSTCVTGSFVPLATPLRKSGDVNVDWEAQTSVQNIARDRGMEERSDLGKYTRPGSNTQHCSHSDKKHFYFLSQKLHLMFGERGRWLWFSVLPANGNAAHCAQKAASPCACGNPTRNLCTSVVFSVSLNKDISNVRAATGWCVWRLFVSAHQGKTLLSSLSCQVTFHSKFSEISCL